MKRVFSGIQPTGNLHLGNWLGAIRNWVALQEGNGCIYSIVDLHSLTVAPQPDELRSSIREVAAAVIAAGIDPKRSLLFAQSQVAEHSELCWILNCNTPLGWLGRMTQFKDKAGRDRELAPLGLMAYPVLMAADILLYRATHVPVGADQTQHLEMARDIAGAFGRRYGPDILVAPEIVLLPEAARIMSLRDGTTKMSKSDRSDLSRINLGDTPEQIAHKIRKARTDAAPLPGERAGLDGRPEATNLVTIMAAVTDRSVDAVCQQWAGQNFDRFKPELAEILIETLEPLARHMRGLLADPGQIDRILAEGAAQAREIARTTMRAVRAATGLPEPLA